MSGPTGGIVGEYPSTDFQERLATSPNGSWTIAFPHSGTVTVVAAAEAGNGISPFSTPLILMLKGPFDWTSTPRWSDGRGPSYTISGEIAEPRIAGQKIAVRKAVGSGRFKPLTTVTVPASRKFKVRFRQRRLGKVRFKYLFKGSEFVATGVYVQKARLKRRSASIGATVAVR